MLSKILIVAAGMTVALGLTALPLPLVAVQSNVTVNARGMEQLLSAAPGAYAFRDDGGIEATASAGRRVFVQADAYRADDGHVQVPVAIGAVVDSPWALQFRIVPESGTDPVATRITNGLPGTLREVRQFSLMPGRYTVHVALATRGVDERWTGTAFVQPVEIPDLSGRLSVSPVVLGDQVDGLPARGPMGPFIFGATGLRPAALSDFSQNDRIHVAFRIYNWTAKSGELPDVSVSYLFNQRIGDHFRFFNKTHPQTLNATSLSKALTPSAEALAAGMTIPLHAFPAGEFELLVRVQDNRSQQTRSERATFAVVP